MSKRKPTPTQTNALATLADSLTPAHRARVGRSPSQLQRGLEGETGSDDPNHPDYNLIPDPPDLSYLDIDQYPPGSVPPFPHTQDAHNIQTEAQLAASEANYKESTYLSDLDDRGILPTPKPLTESEDMELLETERAAYRAHLSKTAYHDSPAIIEDKEAEFGPGVSPEALSSLPDSLPPDHPALKRARKAGIETAQSQIAAEQEAARTVPVPIQETTFHLQIFEVYYALGTVRSPNMLLERLKDLRNNGDYNLPLPTLGEIELWEKAFGWFSRATSRDNAVRKTLDDVAVMNMSETIGKFRLILKTEIDRVADMQLKNPEAVFTRKVGDLEKLVKMCFLLEDKAKTLGDEAGNSGSAMSILSKAAAQGLGKSEIIAIRDRARYEAEKMREARGAGEGA